MGTNILLLSLPVELKGSESDARSDALQEYMNIQNMKKCAESPFHLG